jgi:hypothetical protein
MIDGRLVLICDFGNDGKLQAEYANMTTGCEATMLYIVKSCHGDLWQCLRSERASCDAKDLAESNITDCAFSDLLMESAACQATTR